MMENPNLERVRQLMDDLPCPPQPEIEGRMHNRISNKTGIPQLGIWKPIERNGRLSFARDHTRRPEWPLWANCQEIPPKGSGERVILLGESAARGYFYDPYYNVAMELNGILKASGAPDRTEIIDLARTSMDMDQLILLIRNCKILEPEAVVIFAGNNWGTDSPADGERLIKAISEIYGKDQYPGVRSYMEDRLRCRTICILREIHDSLVKLGVWVVFVIPEFNLKDWRSTEAEQTLPWLPGDKIARWLEEKENTQIAFSDGRIDDARRSALEMTSLDPSNPLGFEFLGQAYLARQQWEEARDCFEAARDTVLLRREDSKPRCFKVIKDTIIAEARKYGIVTVNLPIHFKEECGGIPGKDIFMDYCHLTVKGIKMAMRHVARALMEGITQNPVKLKDIRESGLEPSEKVQATAHFYAAIHNAHAGQGSDILQYHCNKAIFFSREVQKMIVKFIDFSTRLSSTLLCRSFERLVADDDIRQYEGGLALVNPRLQKIMDTSLIESMISAACLPREDIDRLRISEHSVTDGKKDLLQSFYSHFYYIRLPVAPSPFFLQARATTTHISFVADGRDHLFEIVYRTPGGADENRSIVVTNMFDRKTVAHLPMSVNWVKGQFRIAGEALKKGINALTIQWPYLPDQRRPAARRSKHSIYASIFPVLGEIHALTVEIDEVV